MVHNILYYLNLGEPCPPTPKGCLKKSNYLSEFETLVDKEMALENLGVQETVEKTVDDKISEFIDSLSLSLVEEPDIDNLSVLYFDKANKKILWWDGEHFIGRNIL